MARCVTSTARSCAPRRRPRVKALGDERLRERRKFESNRKGAENAVITARRSWRPQWRPCIRSRPRQRSTRRCRRRRRRPPLCPREFVSVWSAIPEACVYTQPDTGASMSLEVTITVSPEVATDLRTAERARGREGGRRSRRPSARARRIDVRGSGISAGVVVTEDQCRAEERNDDREVIVLSLPPDRRSSWWVSSANPRYFSRRGRPLQILHWSCRRRRRSCHRQSQFDRGRTGRTVEFANHRPLEAVTGE